MSLIQVILWPFEKIGGAAVAIGQSIFGSATETGITSAPELKPFNNPVTGGLLSIVLLLIGGGIILIVLGSILGILISSVGIIMWWAGFTPIKPDPRTAMVLTFWGSYIQFGGHPVVVGGNTILANYFPLFLSGTEFEITDVDMDFKVKIYSSDGVAMNGSVSITVQPNIKDAIDYIQSGKMENIRKIIDDIIVRNSKLEGKKHGAVEIASNGDLISGPIVPIVDDTIQAQSLGIKMTKTQASFDMPEDVEATMQQAVMEVYDRKAEFAEYTTDYDAAIELQKRYKADPTMADNMPSLEACIEQIKQLRLIRDGKVLRIDSSGNVGNVVFTNANLNMGGPDKTEKKNRKDRKGDK